MINFWHPDDRAEELAVRRAERDASIQAMKDNVCLPRLVSSKIVVNNCGNIREQSQNILSYLKHIIIKYSFEVALSCQMVTEHANSSANSHLFPPGL